jgi:hypothetical protein
LSQSTFFTTFGAAGVAAGREGVGLAAAVVGLDADGAAVGALVTGAAGLAVAAVFEVFRFLGVGVSSWAVEFIPLITMNPTKPAITKKATPASTQGSLDPELAGAAAAIRGGIEAGAAPPAIV